MPKIRNHQVAEKLLDLFRESVIMQSALTLLLVGSIIIAWLYGVFTGIAVDIPKEMWGFTGLIIGFWYKSKSDQATRKLAELQSKSSDQLVEKMAILLGTAKKNIDTCTDCTECENGT